MEEKTREIWIDGCRIYFGVNNAIFLTPVGGHNEKTAVAIKEACLGLLNKVERKMDVLVDFNKAEKPSREARKIYKEMTESEKIRKIALYGFYPVARILAFAVTSISKNKNIRFFKTKEEALAWLKE
ncbi:MAG: hypothetical protein A3J83_05105 [Elusimicrobia bacterium RIFOXYA2_FULL_40_6]|nr:MAG: hypothetical protein A3J83_05105 [Elusimicrobia bacterium RIFOXYA2_FULL_40_6]